jgi:cytidyltransferase-like protein
VIVETAQLEEFRGRVTMVDGAFDPLHPGHVRYFSAARELGLPVLCNVSSDDYVRTKHAPLLLAHERAEVIDALEAIELTHVSAEPTAKVLARLRPRYYAKGADWRDALPAEELAVCEDGGVEVVYLEIEGWSSTAILQRYAQADT